MPRAPFMQLFPADFLSGTLHLTTEQVGAYTLVFLAMWTAGGSLPNDPAKLARIARVSRQKWDRIGPDVLTFFQAAGDTITQDRLKRDIEKVYSIVEKRSAAGKLGNAAKSLKSLESTSANANAKPERSERILKPEPESEPKTEKEKEGDIAGLPMQMPVVMVASKGQRNRRSKNIATDIEPDFREFMRQFPNPIDEGAAKPAYRRARRKASAAELLDGAVRYATEKRGADPQFIKSPRSWLDAESWKNPPRLGTVGLRPSGPNRQSEEMHDSVSALQRWGNQ
jgi:uncharacterized protein YdaU (DUF1376 family)